MQAQLSSSSVIFLVHATKSAALVLMLLEGEASAALTASFSADASIGTRVTVEITLYRAARVACFCASLTGRAKSVLRLFIKTNCWLSNSLNFCNDEKYALQFANALQTLLNVASSVCATK
jgi:hypothetical protein